MRVHNVRFLSSPSSQALPASCPGTVGQQCWLNTTGGFLSFRCLWCSYIYIPCLPNSTTNTSLEFELLSVTYIHPFSSKIQLKAMLLQMDQLQLRGCTFEIWGSFNNGHIHVLHSRYLEQMWHFSLLLILATPLLTANVNPSPSWEVRYDNGPSLMPGIFFITKSDKKKDMLF